MPRWHLRASSIARKVWLALREATPRCLCVLDLSTQCLGTKRVQQPALQVLFPAVDLLKPFIEEHLPAG